jgi:[ribosomal protein S18]-alanine N-acetyltransferase
MLSRLSREPSSDTIDSAMQPVTIAPATDDEREWAARLMSGSDPWITLGRGLDDCRKACTDETRLLFIAHLEGQPCGFVLLHPRGVAGSPYVRSIAVAAGYRDLGVGSRLLDFAERLFLGKARYIFLCVSSFNVRAKALYERLGYTVVGELVDYVVDGASEILMHKRLVPR